MLINRLWWLLVIVPVYVLVPWAPVSGPVDTNDLLPLAFGTLSVVLLWHSRLQLHQAKWPWLALGCLGFVMLNIVYS